MLKSRVLLVGAGGIGCELLKNLVLTGFGEIHVIDLDTIDLSNLNRQFLFRYEHIKKSKALVAKEAAQKFNPNVKLEAHHANIKDPQFNLGWFSSFQLVFNALDNLDARRHVNKMCLAAKVPLIESGTTGFNGQVQVIIRGKTACYDCNEKMTPKTYPVCTIRSTPSQPIHCIVWAKSYLLPELFGVPDDDIPELDTSENAENAEEIENLQREAQALQQIRHSMGSHDFAQKVFDKVFNEDIERLRRMEDMWKQRKPPEPMSYDQASKEAATTDSQVSRVDQRVWTTSETYQVFFDSLRRLSERWLTEHTEAKELNLPRATITFDKDDADTLDFVAAAANLRSIIFGIEAKSKFDIKQMAGNIIPAIATTNAMIAGLCVIQALKVLKGDLGRTKMIFLNRGEMRTGKYDQPNPNCAVCGVAMTRVWMDLERATLKDLVDGTLRAEVGYTGDMTVLTDQGIIFDPDMEDNLEKKLIELGVHDGSFLTVQDDEEAEEQDPRVNLQLAIEARQDLPADGNPVVLSEKVEIPRRARKLPGAEIPDKQVNGDHVNGAEKEKKITDTTALDTLGIGKRKRGPEEAELDEDNRSVGTSVKKPQTGRALPSDDQGTILVDELEEGAIEID